MGTMPFPPAISLKEARGYFANEQAKYLNLLQIDKWLNFEITDKQLHDNIQEVTP